MEALEFVLTSKNQAKIKYSSARGVDGINGKKFIEMIDNEKKLIQKKVKNNNYKFSNYKENLLIKNHNVTRQVSIPTQRDRLVLQVLLKILRNNFALNDNNIKRKIIDIKKNVGNFDSFIKVDIIEFYPSITHEKLLFILSNKIKDDSALEMIRLAITQPTISLKVPKKKRKLKINEKGIPQGLPISSFLADIYLDKIDKKHLNDKNIKYYRFVDDILILCNQSNIESIKDNISNDFKEIELKIHEFTNNQDKSHSGKIEDGFQYLGYKFTDTLVSVRASSVQRFYDSITKLFHSYKDEGPSNEFVFDLNAKITGIRYQEKTYGWINFFSEINDHTLLFKLDAHVKKMLNKYLQGSNIEVKKFSKAIFEIRKKSSNYITKDNVNKEAYKTIRSLEDDIDFY
ncbi:reverse transcriptase domain-containing protein [Bathymodiolus thermophilus thioautotrophic gill symbiont]|uniref:reverse transcriptase domain-containing protein n=1 Tax=Bathymodiolus thermophilus thioautotrophic gill symbiont TaxID=2360 RepID=UPI001301536E|nr:reverse transcriptase domain-containing protein [Bathymodiolus thermophilus thioautotrophic gill symbiont]